MLKLSILIKGGCHNMTTQTQRDKILREKLIDDLRKFLISKADEYGYGEEDVLQVKSATLCVPMLDCEDNERDIKFSVVIAGLGKKDNKGEEYDPYAEAEAYAMKQKEKAEKERKKAEEKAKKIARDAENRKKREESKKKAKGE